MKLNEDSVRWAVRFLNAHSDGDLFPRVVEISAIAEMEDDFARQIAARDLQSLPPGAARRFIVPKDDVAYRQATQLDPQDSIVLSALIHQLGGGIEARRKTKNRVFSYRFCGDGSLNMYDETSGWKDFWCQARRLASGVKHVLYCDIADCYNQLYHHTIENQLLESGLSNQAVKWIIRLLTATTAGVSRGVPIGPHAVHLIAEAALIPIDDAIADFGMNAVRFADDIVVFCETDHDMSRALLRIATLLDSQQRLMLQRHKTHRYTSSEFMNICERMIDDRPIEVREAQLLALIRKYSGGNPYRSIDFAQVSDADWNEIGALGIREIVEGYLESTPVDFVRLRWLYRRLAQVGHPGALEVSLTRIESLGPCFANLCTYIASIQNLDDEQWVAIGSALNDLLDRDEVQDSEYFGLSLLSLFSRNPLLDNTPRLLNRFERMPDYARREILLAAKVSKASAWIRGRKEHHASMDPWQKRAFIYACSELPREERQFLLKRIETDRVFDSVLKQWAER